jgi:hypothetical protein
VDKAHLACIEDMKGTNYTKPRMNIRSGKLETSDAFEDALYGQDDDNANDAQWLETIKGVEEADIPKTQDSDIPEPEAKTKTSAYTDFVPYPVFKNTVAEIKENIRSNAGYVTNFKIEQEETNERVDRILVGNNDRITALENARPTIIEIKRPEQPETIKLGVQHFNFEHLLIMAVARENVWVYGPAGTGKSTACENIANALGLKFYTNGKLENQFEVLGFENSFKYVRTQFRDAYEHGGVYCGDEIDGSLPSATLAFNGALANGHCAFPDKLVAKHPDFIFIGAANTTGMGGTLEYVSRNKQDAAFNDRFAFLEWPLDEALEDHLCPNKKWLKYVRQARANLVRNPIKGHLITPRASMKGSKLLSYGLSADKVIAATLKKGISDAQWRQIEPVTEIEFSMDIAA